MPLPIALFVNTWSRIPSKSLRVALVSLLWPLHEGPSVLWHSIWAASCRLSFLIANPIEIWTWQVHTTFKCYLGWLFPRVETQTESYRVFWLYCFPDVLSCVLSSKTCPEMKLLQSSHFHRRPRLGCLSGLARRCLSERPFERDFVWFRSWIRRSGCVLSQRPRRANNVPTQMQPLSLFCGWTQMSCLLPLMQTPHKYAYLGVWANIKNEGVLRGFNRGYIII